MVGPFDRQTKQRIVESIVEAERQTSGEIRVHVKPKCGKDPLKEAQKIFHHLRMHRTKHRNGVLIFVAWKSRQFAIVGDEKIHHKVGDSFWNQTRDAMSRHFSKNDLVGGIIAGIQSIGEKLKTHFPVEGKNENELQDKITEN